MPMITAAGKTFEVAEGSNLRKRYWNKTLIFTVLGLKSLTVGDMGLVERVLLALRVQFQHRLKRKLSERFFILTLRIENDV